MLSWAQGIELAEALTSEHHRARWKVLYREGSGVKFNGNVIVTSEFGNRN